MAGFLDKVKSIFTVDYDDDYDEDFYDEYDDEEEAVEATPRFSRRPKTTVQREEVVERPARTREASDTTPRFTRQAKAPRSNKVVPMRGNGMEVCVIKPSYYENTRDIIDTLLEGKAVVLNLEGIKLDLAQRIVDSVSGGCYALHGNLQKISGYIYLVTPSSVDITGDFQDLVSEAADFSSSSFRRNF